MTDYQNIRFEDRDGVGLLVLSRAKVLNALNSALLDELEALLTELRGASLRALVVTGDGSRAFAAGADISEMAEMTAAQAEAFSARGQRVFRAIEGLPFPTIAAVNGFALGGGCELAMSCDLILAGAGAVFGQPEVKLGVIPGFGGTQRLTRRVGAQRALELMLTGRNVKAPEAVAIGLALEVVEEDVVAAALALAGRIAANGPVAVRLTRRAVLETGGLDLDSGLAAERTLFALCFATEDQTEGMAAFLARRPAAFQGR